MDGALRISKRAVKADDLVAVRLRVSLETLAASRPIPQSEAIPRAPTVREREPTFYDVYGQAD